MSFPALRGHMGKRYSKLTRNKTLRLPIGFSGIMVHPKNKSRLSLSPDTLNIWESSVVLDSLRHNNNIVLLETCSGTLINPEEEARMNWKKEKEKLMQNPEFVREYNALEPEYKLAAALIRLRLAEGLTQEDLAS
jgi:hypothetical protein